MSKSDIFVSCVIPVQNGETYIGQAITRLSKTLSDVFTDYELIVVNDGSSDKTYDKVQELQGGIHNIQLYNLSGNNGKEIATVAGMDNAIGDFVVTVDPAQYSVEDVPELIFKAISGYDVVYGVRGKNDVRGIYPRLSALFYKILKRTTGLQLPENATDFRCYSRAAINYFTQLNNRHRLLRVFPAMQGFKYAEVFISETDDTISSYPSKVLMGIRRAMGILLLASPHPMRFVTFMALMGGFLNLLYAVYIVIIAIVKEDVAEGWTSLSLQNAGMFFLICLILAMLAEYLYCLLGNAIGYPIYQITSESTSSVIERRTDLSVLNSKGSILTGDENDITS